MTGLIIDNFAGGGGASTGLEAAFGRPVDVAINHDAEAVAMHQANHPATRHLCQSIMAIDPQDACTVDGRVAKVRLAWFSPDCKHHSKAKGGKPREKNIRDLAWVVVHWPERLGANAPDVIMLENVEEFREWGPLDAEGKPIKERKGEEFDLWLRRLKRCGYKVAFEKLRACDYGAPTIRKRLYLVARRDGLPIRWPAITHGKPGTPEVESGKLLPWRTAAECIDWSIPCRSIFERERPLKEATLRRIAAGTMRYVVNAAKPFIVPLTHHGSDQRVYDLAAPIPTVTGANRGEMAAVDVTIAPHITKFRGGAIGADIAEPMPTITANGNPTRPAGAQPLALASACLSPFYGEKAGGKVRAANSVDEPLRTQTCEPRFGLVTALLSTFYTNGGKHDIEAPAPTITAASQHHALLTAHLEQANGGPRNGNLAGRPVDVPVSTVTATGSQQRLVQTMLVDADSLPPEQLAGAVRVAAFLIKYYGNEEGGHGLDAPLGTVTTLDRFAVVTVTIDARTYIIVDIGMRMLKPRELARAQGFPDSYILDPIGPNGKPLSQSAQIRMIGNSVCPDVAEALVRANMPELAEMSEAA
jgi:DNA (cytosine-5)-methyltransferase 1